MLTKSLAKQAERECLFPMVLASLLALIGLTWFTHPFLNQSPWLQRYTTLHGHTKMVFLPLEGGVSSQPHLKPKYRKWSFSKEKQSMLMPEV